MCIRLCWCFLSFKGDITHKIHFFSPQIHFVVYLQPLSAEKMDLISLCAANTSFVCVWVLFF